jgi:hypothetical protein
MLHFAHLTRGGFLRTAASFDEHFRQLASALEDETNGVDELQEFIREFLRPHGVGKPAVSIVVDAIEQTGAIQAAPLPRWPRIFSPLLYPFAVLLHRVAAEQTGKKWDNVEFSLNELMTAATRRLKLILRSRRETE